MNYCLQCSSWWCRIPNQHPVSKNPPSHKDEWEKGSDYSRSGDSVWYDSTRGTVLISGGYKGLK